MRKEKLSRMHEVGYDIEISDNELSLRLMEYGYYLQNECKGPSCIENLKRYYVV